MADELLAAPAGGGGKHQLVAFEDADPGGVDPEKGRRLLDHVRQHGLRIELRSQQAARPRELLRQSPRAAFRLERLGPLDRGLCRIGQLLRDLDVFVRERMRLREEDERECGELRSRHRDGHGKERGGRLHEGSFRAAEAVVFLKARGGEHPPLTCRVLERFGARRTPLREHACERVRQLVASAELEAAR